MADEWLPAEVRRADTRYVEAKQDYIESRRNEQAARFRVAKTGEEAVAARQAHGLSTDLPCVSEDE